MKIYIIVYVLAITDYILTAIGILFGWVTETNPLFEVMNTYPIEIASLTILIVGMTLGWIYRQHLTWAKYPLYFVAVTKVGIIYLHSGWIYKVISGG